MHSSHERNDILIPEKCEGERILGKPRRRWKDINYIWS
jgi:hypothetical protein